MELLDGGVNFKDLFDHARVCFWLSLLEKKVVDNSLRFLTVPRTPQSDTLNSGYGQNSNAVVLEQSLID